MTLKTIELIALLLVIALAMFYFSRKERASDSLLPGNSSSSDIEDFISRHGEPLEVIIVNPLASSDMDGSILVYDDHLVVAGQEVKRDNIESMTFNNAAIPYVNSQYQLVITSSDESQPVVRMAIGGDAKWAGEVLSQLSEALDRKF